MEAEFGEAQAAGVSAELVGDGVRTLVSPIFALAYRHYFEDAIRQRALQLQRFLSRCRQPGFDLPRRRQNHGHCLGVDCSTGTKLVMREDGRTG